MFVVVRGRHAAMCRGPDIQLGGASGIVCVSLLCDQRQLPAGYSQRRCNKVAARQPHPPWQLLHQWGWQSFQGLYTQLHPSQGLPHLQHPGSRSWRSSDQSWMWVKFHFCFLLCTDFSTAFSTGVSTNSWVQTHNSDKSTKKSMINKALSE